MPAFAPTTVPTDRLRTNVWTSGPDDGVPLLLVHGNLVSGGWWRYVAELLPDDVVGARFYSPDDAEAALRERLEEIRRARGRG